MYMDQYISTRKAAQKKALLTKAPTVNNDALQPGGALAGKINCDKPHWPNPVIGSGVSFQLCPWDSGQKVFAQIQY